jgi:hypothetical protein
MQKVKELLRRRGVLPPPDLNETVLRCVYDRKLADPGARAIASAAQIAVQLDLSEDVILDALQQLADDEYIDIAVLSGGGRSRPLDMMVKNVLPEGLRALGAWPK